MGIPAIAEIICIGTELLLGEVTNSNAQFLAQELAQLGIRHHYQTVVGDNPQRIQEAIAIAQERAQILIFTGGLGPTPDDLTTETIAAHFKTPLVEQPDVVTLLRERYAQRGLTLTPNNLKQALIPQGADLLPNPTGTAPGIIWQPQPGLHILTFPGVPSEMKRMWQDTAIPYLHSQGFSHSTLVSRSLRFWGISESALATRVESFFNQTNPTVAPYAGRGEVRLRITAQAPTAQAAAKLIEPTAQALITLGSDHYFGSDDDTLASVVGQALQDRGETLAVAESCTGGGLGYALTHIPGSSSYFHGGIIAYDNRVKTQVLGINPLDLDQWGAVSGVVAEQMALGVRQRLGTDWGLSITGIAGPGGGSDDKPVGLVYIGLADPQGQGHHYRCTFGSLGGRDWVRHMSISEALDRLRRQLKQP